MVQTAEARVSFKTRFSSGVDLGFTPNCGLPKTLTTAPGITSIMQSELSYNLNAIYSLFCLTDRLQLSATNPQQEVIVLLRNRETSSLVTLQS
ncbi:hypothetical protein L1987_64908 [Smallanthus sonchifolius]|uniref:Uncharacterized protein n=1 Tax=Smallanthus sonchifolius TaxID=185202 RepID=A0ACB9BSV5_9ASTR|nr:hypothetical protein L1987_64908 [Smallanthus sonchifolius]